MNYNWNEFYNDIVSKASNIADLISTDTIDSVYGVPRGGIPVAIALSYQYGIPIADTPTIKTLIVDDYMDTGQTLLEYPEHFKFVLVATTYKKETTLMNKLICKPRVSKEVPTFPWDDEEKESEEAFTKLYRSYGEGRELVTNLMVEKWGTLLDGYGNENFKVTMIDTYSRKNLEIKYNGIFVDEDEFYPYPFALTAQVTIKSKKMPNPDDVNTLIKNLSHRLVSPHDLADSIYEHLKKIYTNIWMIADIKGIKYEYGVDKK